MNELKVGDKIISKKNHPCGNNVWEVTRLGADIKIKCALCGRSLFVTYDQLIKRTKSIVKREDNDKNS